MHHLWHLSNNSDGLPFHWSCRSDTVIPRIVQTVFPYLCALSTLHRSFTFKHSGTEAAHCSSPKEGSPLATTDPWELCDYACRLAYMTTPNVPSTRQCGSFGTSVLGRSGSSSLASIKLSECRRRPVESPCKEADRYSQTRCAHGDEHCRAQCVYQGRSRASESFVGARIVEVWPHACGPFKVAGVHTPGRYTCIGSIPYFQYRTFKSGSQKKIMHFERTLRESNSSESW